MLSSVWSNLCPLLLDFVVIMFLSAVQLLDTEINLLCMVILVS